MKRTNGVGSLRLAIAHFICKINLAPFIITIMKMLLIRYSMMQVFFVTFVFTEYYTSIVLYFFCNYKAILIKSKVFSGNIYIYQIWYLAIKMQLYLYHFIHFIKYLRTLPSNDSN